MLRDNSVARQRVANRPVVLFLLCSVELTDLEPRGRKVVIDGVELACFAHQQTVGGRSGRENRPVGRRMLG